MPIIKADKYPLDAYLRTERLPHVWCPGCGLGIVLNAFLRAMQALGMDPDKTVVVSGIGCTGRTAGYVKMDSFHTTHGRAIPFALGIKAARPDLNVVVFSGDGDLFSIGGNHIIHAARRNIDITVIAVNNFIYGMTGGQLAPTTPETSITTTSPYGNLESPFNMAGLMAIAGASYVARWTTVHARRLEKGLEKALSKRGFSFVEVMSPCPTTFGRRNKMKGIIDSMMYYQKYAVIKDNPNPLDGVIKPNEKFVIGEFMDAEDEPTFDDKLWELTKRDFLETSQADRAKWILEHRRHLETLATLIAGENIAPSEEGEKHE